MSSNGFDTKVVKDLAKILRDSDLTEIELDHQGTKIRVTRQAPAQQVVGIPQALPAQFAPAPVAEAAAAPVAAAPAKAEAVKGNVITSPMVGTAYLSPEPGARPFVSIGDNVKEGQQLFIVEAMKTLNAVTANVSGKVVAIHVKDAQPVEFGEALCVIE